MGTTPDYTAHYRAELAQGALWQQPMDAVLGATVARHQLTTRRKISLSVVDSTAFAFVDPEDYPHPCGARRLPNSL